MANQAALAVRFAAILGARDPSRVSLMTGVEPWPYNENFSDYADASGRPITAGLAEAWMLHTIAKQMMGHNPHPRIACELADGSMDVDIDPFDDNSGNLAGVELKQDDDRYLAFLHVALNGVSAPERMYFILHVHKNLSQDTLRSFYAMLQSNIQIGDVLSVCKWITVSVGHWTPDQTAKDIANRYPWLRYRMVVATAGGLILEAMSVCPRVLTLGMLGREARNVFVRAAYSRDHFTDIEAHYAIPSIGLAYAYIVLAAAGKNYGEFYSGRRAMQGLPTTTARRWRAVIANYIRLSDTALDPLVNEDAAAYATRMAGLIANH